MFISFGSRSSNFISFLLVLSLFLVSCSKKDESSLSSGSSTKEEKVTIQNAGSDTMVNLAQAWAESYASLEQKISVEVDFKANSTDYSHTTRSLSLYAFISMLLKRTCGYGRSTDRQD